MRRSSSLSSGYKKQRKPVVQSVQLRRLGGKWRPEPRQRVAEEEERKKRTREYLQRLQDEVLEEEAEGFQAAGSKRKEIATGDEEEQQPSKKARGKQPGKYRGGAAVKMGGATPCERCVCAGQDCLVHLSR